MKKLLVTILAMCVIFSLAACGSSDNTSAATEAPKTTEATEAPTTAESVDLNESVTSSGKLPGGMTAAEHPEITTEGKSQDTILTISQNVDIAGIDAFAAAQSGRNDIRYLIYDQLAIMAKPGGSVQEMAFQMAKTITEVDDTTMDIEIYLKKYFDSPRGVVHAVDDVTFNIEAGTTISAWIIIPTLCRLRAGSCCGPSLSSSAGNRPPGRSSARNTRPEEAIYEEHDHAPTGTPAFEPCTCGYRIVCRGLFPGRSAVLFLPALQRCTRGGVAAVLALPALRQAAVVEFRPAL